MRGPGGEWYRRLMRRAPFVLLFSLVGACAGDDPDPVDVGAEALALVDPFIGSGGLGFAVGSIPPGPTMPFGFAKPGPDTSRLGGGAVGFAHCAGYWYEDDEIRAFSQIHLSGTGVPDYGALGIMPIGGLPAGPITADTYRDRFDHREESAEVGRYQVTLSESRIHVDVSATPFTAVYRLAYPAAGGALVVDLAHGLASGRTTDGSITASDAGEVSGWLHHEGGMSGRYGGFRLYFVMRFEHAPTAVVPFARYGARLEGTRTATGADAGMVLGFGAARSVGVQIGLSFVDEATARANLDAEWVGFDLELAVQRAKAAWAPLLSVIAIEGGTPAERRSFYSALFRAHHMPTDITEAGGQYRGIDRQVHVAEGWTYHTDFSLWDTFRTLHPLFTLIQPGIQRDFSRSIVAMTEAGGMIPRWPLGTGETWTMIGSHGESAIIDGWVKGVRDFDVDALWARVWPGVIGTSTFLGETRSSRECIGDWTTHNFCSKDAGGGGTVSRTLENAYNDWLLAQLADGLGKTAQADTLRTRSGGWANLFDPSTGYLRARMSDGTFEPDFDEATFLEDYTEGNARQWFPYVPHDLPGLAAKLGSNEAMIMRMQAFFEGARGAEKTFLADEYYWHGNEPDIHAAYVFAELGRPDLTQEWVNWILDARYADTPAGLDGNDDAGTLSAWYVFAAMGLYPKVGTTTYYLTAPRFTKTTLTLGTKTVVIRTEHVRGPITKAIWNGVALPGLTIDHAQLIAGGELVLE